MRKDTIMDEIRTERLRVRAEARRAVAHLGFLQADIAILTEDKDEESRIAILENWQLLYGALGDQEESVYKAVLSRLDRYQEKSTEVRWRAIETLITLASQRLRNDAEAIVALSDCLNMDSDSKVQQWAIAGLCPAAAAGDAEVIRVLRRSAMNPSGDSAVRQEAIDTLEDLGIPIEEPERVTLQDWLNQRLGTTKRIAMAFGTEDATSHRLDWSDECRGTLYRREGVLYLRLVDKSSPAGAMAIVVYHDAEGARIMKPALFRQNSEGVIYTDVSLAGIDKHGEVAQPIILDAAKLEEEAILEVLEATFAQAAEADKAVWKEWANSLTNVPEPLVNIVARMKNA